MTEEIYCAVRSKVGSSWKKKKKIEAMQRMTVSLPCFNNQLKILLAHCVFASHALQPEKPIISA